MNSTQAYALSKTYVDDSIRGIVGVLAGKNCTIKSTDKVDGVTTIVFQWTADDGKVKTSQIQVKDGVDGTPIYTYTAGTTYHVGDLVIYDNQWYRCISEHVAPATFDPSKFEGIGSAEGSYGLAATEADLPSGFGADDKKVYFVIEDGTFWLWNGIEWEQQSPSLPLTNEQLNTLLKILD